MKLSCLFLFGLALAHGADLLQQAAAHAAPKINPFDDDNRARRAGAKLFARECAACHGEDARGIGKAPALRRADVEQAAPGTLFWILKNGSLYRGMPSFAHLPEQQRWQIVTFLKSLNK
jgi:mono/diheme cytochrome c family protein